MGKMLYWLSIIRSYIFCFRYMPRKMAICCPILIYWNTKCYISPKARIRINVLGGVKKHKNRYVGWKLWFATRKNALLCIR